MSEDPLRWTHPDAEPPPEALALVRRLEGPPPLPPDLRGQVFGGTRAAIRRARWAQPGLGITAIAAGVALVWFVTPKDDPAERVASAAIAPEVAEESNDETASNVEATPEVALALALGPDAESRGRDAGPRRAASAGRGRTPPRVRAASERDELLARPDPPRDPDIEAEARECTMRGDNNCVIRLLARECAMRGDNACVIRLLEGHAQSPDQLESLIEAYRARGQTAPALRHMRTYVGLSDGPRARDYRQILERRSRGRDGVAQRPPTPTPGDRVEYGYLTINTMPWARVFIDGRDTGRNTPVREMRLPAGRHTIGLRTNDGVMHAIQVAIRPGGRERIVRRFADLEPPGRVDPAIR